MRKLALSVMLLAAISALETAGASDYVLGIFGNANMDSVVDQKDIDYVRGVINGTNAQTLLSDACNDGAVDEKDIEQIGQIISGTETNLTLIDSKNVTVSIKMPLKRVVSLSDDSVELMRSIGAQGSIVGVESRVNDNEPFFGAISRIPSVGKWNDPDLEAILKLQPDAIICYTEYPSKDKLEEKLSKNIPVLRFECDDPDKMDRETAELGYIFNRRNESEKLIDFYDGVTSDIESKVSGLKEQDRPTVFMEWSADKYKSFTRGMSFDMVCTMAGGRNIASDLETRYSTKYPTLDAEWVTAQNPQIFLRMASKTDGGYANGNSSKMKASYEEMLGRTALSNVSAMKNRDVYVLSAWEVIDTPRFFVGLSYLAKIFHPDLFKDLDPEELHKEYLSKFQGIPYQGVYLYPELKAGQ